MVQVTQTEEEIRIIIKLINIKSKTPDIVLLPNYVKFNLHPIFFEGHLKKEVDESASTCKLFKNEARIILKKKIVGLWDEIFENLSKQEALEKRKEMVDALQAQNQNIEKELLKRYDDKKKFEIHREIERDTEIRQKYDENTKLLVDEHLNSNEICTLKEIETKTTVPQLVEEVEEVVAAAPPPPVRQIVGIRPKAKITVSFSNFGFKTPKRESQEEWQAAVQAEALRKSMKIV